jgi:exodeoxyribonuclease VII small subunit
MTYSPDQLNQVQIDQMTYEQAFTQLEEIVALLESNEHPLDTALSLFERGQALARYCAGLLDQAELRIQQLSADTLVDDPSLDRS